MRILHVDTAPTWRGGQNQVLLTAGGMAARGHEVTVACRTGGLLEQRAREAGLVVRPAPFRGDFSPGAGLALARTMRAFRPHVVQLHDPHAVAAGLLAARLAPPVRTVATRRVDFPLRGWLSRWKYRSCDRVIAVSRKVAAILEQGGIAKDSLRIVYEGVPDPTPRSGGAEALLGLGIPPGALVVGNAAALTDHKDHATLLEAAARVLPRLPEVRFVVAGDGALRPRLQSRARELRLGDRFVFAGFRSDLDRLLPAFTVFCLSSHMEGLGTSLLDAMAHSLPIVATAAGGIPEAVEEGVTGRLVPVRDPEALATALVEVLRDPERRQAMGAAGRRRFLELFTADRMVEETLKVFEELR